MWYVDNTHQHITQPIISSHSTTITYPATLQRSNHTGPRYLYYSTTQINPRKLQFYCIGIRHLVWWKMSSELIMYYQVARETTRVFLRVFTVIDKRIIALWYKSSKDSTLIFLHRNQFSVTCGQRVVWDLCSVPLIGSNVVHVMLKKPLCVEL